MSVNQSATSDGGRGNTVSTEEGRKASQQVGAVAFMECVLPREAVAEYTTAGQGNGTHCAPAKSTEETRWASSTEVCQALAWHGHQFEKSTKTKGVKPGCIIL